MDILGWILLGLGLYCFAVAIFDPTWLHMWTNRGFAGAVGKVFGDKGRRIFIALLGALVFGFGLAEFLQG